MERKKEVTYLYNSKLEKISIEKGKELTDRIEERAKSENLPSNAIQIILGLCLAGIENIVSEEFVEGAKRILEITHEEYINTMKQIKNTYGDEIYVC